MRGYFEATAESYFKHLTRDGIEAAVAEAKGDGFAEGSPRMRRSTPQPMPKTPSRAPAGCRSREAGSTFR
ncbi:hypothetical protein C6558_38095 [Ensifer sp. NM-2]|nr:hypothetical protein C6558_38095 [Ensifer sp. NM-2]